MALILRSIYNSIKKLDEENRNQWLEDYPFISSPIALLALLAVYALFVQKYGQIWMRNRKPFHIERIIQLFDILQILVNLYLFIGVNYYGYIAGDINFLCSAADRSDPKTMNPYRLKVIHISYVYFLIKLSDLLDTVFFVLRKNNRQITFLHVYHHILMVICSYIHFKYMICSQATFLGLINSLVHTIMYTYYFLTSIKPELKKSLWWKKHITQLQMIQFVILGVHFSLPMFIDCGYSQIFAAFAVSQQLVMFVLFLNFYLKAYCKPKIKQ